MERLKLILILVLFLLLGAPQSASSQCSFLSGNTSETFTTSGLCGPTTVDWDVSFEFIAPVNPAQILIRFDWGDPANTITDVPAFCSSGNTSCSPASGAVNFSYPLTTIDCEFSPSATVAYDANSNGMIEASELCSGSTITRSVRSWSNDDFGTGSMAITPALTQQCVGEPLAGFQFQDNSTPNCNNGSQAAPNQLERWVQFVYGTTSESGAYIPDVSVDTGGGSVQITNSAGAIVNTFYGPVIKIPAFVGPNDLTELSFPISYGSNSTIGEIFEVTLRNWNTCNPYDNNPFDGMPPANVQDGDNTPVTAIAKIEIIGPTVANAGTDQQICGNSTFLSANTPLVGIGQWQQVSGPGTVNFSDVNLESSPISVNVFGTYEIEWAINLGSCVSRDTLSVTFNDDPSDPFTGPDQQVCGLSSNLLANNPAVGTGTWVQVAGPTGLSIVTPSSPTSVINATNYGTYTLEWRIANANCPTKSEQQEITFFENPSTANAGADQQVCGLNAALNATPLAVGMGQWTLASSPTGASTGFSNIASPTSTFISDAYGDYDLVWTASNGNCPSNSDTVQFRLEPASTAPDAGQDQQVCGLSTSLNANAPSIGSGSWVQVSGPSTLGISDINNPQATVTASAYGLYELAWQTQNAVCPILSDTVRITFLDNPTPANAGPDQAVCGLSTTMGANIISVGSGTWTIVSSPAGSSPALANANNPNTALFSNSYGIYNLVWTASNGSCTANSDTVMIQFNDNPSTPNAGPDQDICGLTASLNANQPAIGTGIWIQTGGPSTLNFTDSTSSGTTVTATAFGTYTLEWRISNANCPVKADPIQLSFFDTPSFADAGPDQTICGNNTFLNANNVITGSGQWSVISSPSGSGPILNNPSNPSATFVSDSAGMYLLTWTVSNGPCTPSIDTVQITFVGNPDVPVTGPDQFLCDLTTTLAANVPTSGTGQWVQTGGPTGLIISNPASPNATITAVNHGTYTLEWRISNAPCATLADPVQITFYDTATTPDAGMDRLICGLSTNLEGNSINIGSGQWSIISQPAGSNPVLSNFADSASGLSSDSAGLYVLQWTSSNGTCPSDSDRVNITLAEVPNFAIDSQSNTLCYGDCNGEAFLSPTRGEAPFYFTWSGEAERQGPSLTDLCAGNYSVTITDKNGCKNTGSVIIAEADSISASFTVTAANCNLFDGSINLTASGGTGNLSYHWNTGVRTEDIQSVAAGLYVATIRDQNNCIKLVSVAVSNIGGPPLSLNSVSPVSCNGLSNGAIDINAGGNDNIYLWSNGAKTEDIVNLQAGPYYMVAVDTMDSCASVISVNVPEPDEIGISLSVTDATCSNPDGSAAVSISGGNGNNTINWSSGNTGSSVTGLQAGVYSVTVSDFKGCSETRHFAISHDVAPGIFTDSIIDVVCGANNGSIYVSTTGNSGTYNFLWSNGDTTEDLINVPDGLYSLQLTDTNGCQGWYVNTIDQVTGVNPEICMVQVDSPSNFNQVIWKPLADPGAFDYFNVYRESTFAGNYHLIGSRDADSVGIFNDSISNPFFKSYRYKISVVDTCGVESELSPSHKTIHLVQVPGLSGSNTINLLWDDYEGFPYGTYYIYRNSQTNGFELIDSLAAGLNSYIDTFNISDPRLSYLVMVNTPQDCDPTKADDYGRVRSNTSSTLFSPAFNAINPQTKVKQVILFPVPTENSVFVDGIRDSIVKVEITDLSGNVLETLEGYDRTEGVSLQSYPQGIYLLRIYLENDLHFGKVIKK